MFDRIEKKSLAYARAVEEGGCTIAYSLLWESSAYWRQRFLLFPGGVGGPERRMRARVASLGIRGSQTISPRATLQNLTRALPFRLAFCRLRPAFGRGVGGAHPAAVSLRLPGLDCQSGVFLQHGG